MYIVKKFVLSENTELLVMMDLWMNCVLKNTSLDNSL